MPPGRIDPDLLELRPGDQPLLPGGDDFQLHGERLERSHETYRTMQDPLTHINNHHLWITPWPDSPEAIRPILFETEVASL
nr:hypothetical protein GCM10025730_23250 [Promicromonospora thailandica]